MRRPRRSAAGVFYLGYICPEDRDFSSYYIVMPLFLISTTASREQRTGFFLEGFIKPPLRKQRTKFFSLLSRNVPSKKKRSPRSRLHAYRSREKALKTPFFHNERAINSSAFASFFLKVPLITVKRTILCPLFSRHPQNQSVENKSLSSVPLRA